MEVHDVKIIGISAIIENEGVTHHFLTYDPLLFVVRINNHVKSLKPDVVLVAGLLYPIQVLMLKTILPKEVKIVVQHHAESPLGIGKALFQRFAKKYIQGFLFAAKDLAKPWIQKGQVSNSKIYEIMEASSFFHPLSRQDAIKITGLQIDHTYLWVGRLNQNKNPLAAINAFAKFIKQNDASLYMIFGDNELHYEVERAVKQLGVGNNVHLIGKVEHSQMLFWYNSTDFIISTSEYEGSGIAVCEAMSCGCIPIVANIPSFSMMTDGGKTGILFEPNTKGSLEVALEQSLKINKELMRNLVLQRYASRLSFSAIAKEMEAVFRTL